jgi:hypothetical protein
MNKVLRSAVIVAGLVFTLGTVSWAGPAPNNDPSDNVLRNTAGGTGALQSSGLTGLENTAFGYWALLDNTSGSDNTAFGDGALVDTQEGSDNTAIGAGALEFSTSGNFNTASGAFALYSNTSGDNTADGYGALYSNTSGTFNTASGASALSLNTSGANNTASGYNTLSGNTGGSYNTALGYQALNNSTGSRNLALGYNAGYKLTSGDKNIYVGNSGVAAKESNTIRLGQAPNQSRAFIAGIYGVAVGTGSPKPVYINGNGQLGTSTAVIVSSARYKRDIQDMRERSHGLYQLRPVTFRYKEDAQGQRQYGLIAEEVVKVYPELVTKGADGKVEGVEYQELIPMLLNEVQHQQQKLAAQSQELAELKAQNAEQRAQNAALAARLERLEEGAVRAATLTSH